MWIQAGIACSPITVSTAIFSGSGTSRESGVEIRLRNVIMTRWGEHGFASRTMRRNSRRSDFEVEVSKPNPQYRTDGISDRTAGFTSFDRYV